MTAGAVSRAPTGEAGFRLLAEHLPDLVLLAFDPELRIWAATGVALRARGWTSGDFVGKRVPAVGGPRRRRRGRGLLRAALAGECRRLQTTGSKDPSRLWTQLFVPLPDERGAVIGGMLIARDVTDQRRAEGQLLARRRQLAEAQRIAHVGSWERDLASDMLDLSDELCRILGLPAGSRLAIADLARVIHPDDLEIVITDRRRLLGRIYEAQEGQDRRLAADLHDGHVQSLSAIGFKLEQARLRLGATGSPEADELLWQVTKDLSDEVTSLRRTIGRLRPLVPVEDGLETALRGEAKSACFGLIAMRERDEALGGRFRVTTAPGQGTVVEARLPLSDPAEWRWGA